MNNASTGSSPRHHRSGWSEFQYVVDGGDGRWLLQELRDGKVSVRISTPGTELAFAYDRSCGTLHKHGSPELVNAWLEKTKQAFSSGGYPEMAADLQLLSAHSYPLLGDPRPGVDYLSVDDANRIISTSGYILQVVAKLSAIDVDAIEVQPAPR